MYILHDQQRLVIGFLENLGESPYWEPGHPGFRGLGHNNAIWGQNIWAATASGGCAALSRLFHIQQLWASGLGSRVTWVSASPYNPAVGQKVTIGM